MKPNVQIFGCLIAGKKPPNSKPTHRSRFLDTWKISVELLNSVGLELHLCSRAGVKGKVLSALAHGLPMVTTSIGAEGIIHDERRCDAIAQADGAEAFAAEILAYQSESGRTTASNRPFRRQFIDDQFDFIILGSTIDLNAERASICHITEIHPGSSVSTARQRSPFQPHQASPLVTSPA